MILKNKDIMGEKKSIGGKSLKEGIDVKIVYADDTPSEYIDDVTHNDILDIIEESPEVYKIFDVSGSKKKLVWSDEYGFERAYESKESAKKSLKERDDTIFSKDVKRWMLSGNDINITFKDGNEHRKDSEDKKAECFLCEDLTADYTGDYFIVEVYNGKIYEIKFQSYDWLEHYMDDSYDLMESKKSARKSIKESNQITANIWEWQKLLNGVFNFTKWITKTFVNGETLHKALEKIYRNEEITLNEFVNACIDYIGDYRFEETVNKYVKQFLSTDDEIKDTFKRSGIKIVESKKSARKLLKEQFVGKGEGGYRKPRANKNNSGVCKDSNGVNHKVIFDIHVEDFIVWVDNDNYLMWDIYSAGGLKRNLLKSDLDEKLIDEIAELGKQLIYGFDTDF